MTKTSTIENLYGSEQKAFKARDDKHTPYNKREFEVKGSIALVEVQDYNGKKPNAHNEAWTQIKLTEITTAYKGGGHEEGRTHERTISVTLDAAGRKLLREYLDACENKTW